MLSYAPRREADRVYSILTRDFGLIRATGGGVRKEVSKLRGSLEPVSLSKISLVKGRESWRITSAELVEKVVLTDKVARPLALLEKLMQGEHAHTELYDAIERALLDYQGNTLMGNMFEVRFVAQILFHLGYLKESDLKLDKKELVRAINSGIEASGL